MWYIFGEFGNFLNVDKQASAKCPVLWFNQSCDELFIFLGFPD
jgi:hypothetical protein